MAAVSPGCWAAGLEVGNGVQVEGHYFDYEDVSFSPPSQADFSFYGVLSFLKKKIWAIKSVLPSVESFRLWNQDNMLPITCPLDLTV